MFLLSLCPALHNDSKNIIALEETVFISRDDHCEPRASISGTLKINVPFLTSHTALSRSHGDRTELIDIFNPFTVFMNMQIYLRHFR